ncbi:MAG TPA: ATP-binding protein [Rhodocyclaceae bacterium]|nr:ATP-binding protein [Rhodocyclaceae bacterium]
MGNGPGIASFGTARFFRRLATGVALLNIAVLALVALALSQSFQNYRQQADITTQNLSRTLSQSIASTIAQVDLGLLAATDELERQLAAGKPDANALTAFLTRQQHRLPWVVALRATDENGRIRYGTGVTPDLAIRVNDRDYFIALQNDTRLELFINRPVLSRMNKIWVLIFARRLNYPDGRFAGVVFANISLDNIDHMFAAVDIGSQGAINLRASDLSLIARHPVPPDLAGSIGNKDISQEFRDALAPERAEGTFYTPTSFDNTARVVSFHRVEGYPLLVTVGLARWDFLQEWRSEAMQMAGLTVMFMLISWGGMVLIGRAWRRQLDMVDRLRREEEKFHTVADYTYDWEYWEGEDGTILYMAPACERMTGYPATAFVASPGLLMNIIHPDDRDAMANHRHDVAGKEQAELDYRIVRRDGEVRWISHCCRAVFSQEGGHLGRRVSNRDITERKRSEEELRRYKDHLEETVQQRTADLVLARNAAETANKAKSVFLANMSHELRTPLNAILGFSSMMRSAPHLPEELRQHLDIINRSGEHLLSLINDVLEMAKIEAGRVQLEHQPFDLGALVRDVTDMMEVRARAKGLRLLIDQTSDFPRYIVGDESRLRQVLINLVGNAVKFTTEGGVTVRLGTRQNRYSHLIIEVEDTGPGIAPEDQQRIFEPFIQLGEHRDSKGTGLGLTITRQFVELMGGKVHLHSTPGSGSLFRVDLPLTAFEDGELPMAKPLGQGDIVGLAPGQPEYRILIVEDQLENQLLLARLMESVGFQVRVAENGKQGIEMFQEWHPHFIWMDRKMPLMDGLEATRLIRALPGGKEVKIVAVTASAFQEQREEMLEGGMDGFVRKPYRFAEIYDCLEQLLGVSYIREAPPEPSRPKALAPEMFAPLPLPLLDELRGALESLETERISLAIEAVGKHDVALKKTLAAYVERFDYPAILKAMQSSRSEKQQAENAAGEAP